MKAADGQRVFNGAKGAAPLVFLVHIKTVACAYKTYLPRVRGPASVPIQRQYQSILLVSRRQMYVSRYVGAWLLVTHTSS